MFQEMRRRERQLDRGATDAILVAGTYGVLSVAGEDGHPYGVPLTYVYTGDRLYFHCALEGRKLDCIRANDKVSFCVVGEAEPLADEFGVRYKSAVVFGTAGEVVDREEKMKALAALLEKYASGDDYTERGKVYAAASCDKTAVVRIDVAHVTGKGGK